MFEVEILSDEEEEEEEMVSVHEDRYRPQSLERMIALISLLVEKSRGEDNRLGLSDRDLSALMGGKVRIGGTCLFSQDKSYVYE